MIGQIETLRADEVTVALDLLGGIATLVCAMVAEAGFRLVHTPGLSVNRARQGMRGGENKSDPRDAATIAELARTRPGLRTVDAGREIDVDIRLPIGRRRELVQDQTRRLARLRDLLSSLFPALERRVDVNTRTGLAFLGPDAAPHELRSARAASVAKKVIRTGPHLRGVLQLANHPDAALIQSLPGMGVVLTAELIANIGDIRRFRSADALAAAAGLTPVLRQSGKSCAIGRANSGDKALRRVSCQSAFVALAAPESRAFHDRKRAEGKRHNQAVIALARRRINVVWAMLTTRQPFAENFKAAA